MPYESNFDEHEETLPIVPDGEKPRRQLRRPGDRRPQIMLGADEYRVVRQAVAVLRADHGIYQRGGWLVRVNSDATADVVNRPHGVPTIGRLPKPSLRERITERILLTTINVREETIPAHPPTWLVDAIDARGEWDGIRPLVGVSESPILRPDGSVCDTAGYDPSTGVLYAPREKFPPVPPKLEREDAWRASESLFEVVVDFRFESDDHKAAWLAALLTPIARYAFEGNSPFFLVDANVRGAGKGLLVQSIGQIVLGKSMPVSAYSDDDDEMRKRITSIAMAGDRVVLLDNIVGNFGNSSMDRAMTGDMWKDRVLGENRDYEGPLLATWYGTGNNVQLGGDMPRRTIHIRLDVLDERPELRTGFRHADLLRWIRSQRPRLLVDALTILAAYMRSGSPASLPGSGSFEGWSNLVRQAIVWIGLPDPCATQAELIEGSDMTAEALAGLIAAWQEYDVYNRGIVVSELMRELYGSGFTLTPEAFAMKNAIEAFVGVPSGRAPTARQVSGHLKSAKRKVSGGLFLDCPNRNKLGMKWHVYSTEIEPTCEVAPVGDVADLATPLDTPTATPTQNITGERVMSLGVSSVSDSQSLHEEDLRVKRMSGGLENTTPDTLLHPADEELEW